MRNLIIKVIAGLVTVIGGVQAGHTQSKTPSPAEIAKAAEAARQRAMLQFDANRDGVLSDQERALAEQAAMQSLPLSPGMPVGANQQLRQFDRDGDGRLSAPEIRLAREFADRMRKGGGSPQRGFTPGANNALSPAAAQSAAEAKAEKVSPLVKRFDKDGDGKLNEEEKAAAQAELKNKKKDKAEKAKDDKAEQGKAKDEGKPADKAGK